VDEGHWHLATPSRQHERRELVLLGKNITHSESSGIGVGWGDMNDIPWVGGDRRSEGVSNQERKGSANAESKRMKFDHDRNEDVDLKKLKDKIRLKSRWSELAMRTSC